MLTSFLDVSVSLSASTQRRLTAAAHSLFALRFRSGVLWRGIFIALHLMLRVGWRAANAGDRCDVGVLLGRLRTGVPVPDPPRALVTTIRAPPHVASAECESCMVVWLLTGRYGPVLSVVFYHLNTDSTAFSDRFGVIEVGSPWPFRACTDALCVWDLLCCVLQAWSPLAACIALAAIHTADEFKTSPVCCSCSRCSFGLLMIHLAALCCAVRCAGHGADSRPDQGLARAVFGPQGTTTVAALAICLCACSDLVDLARQVHFLDAHDRKRAGIHTVMPSLERLTYAHPCFSAKSACKHLGLVVLLAAAWCTGVGRPPSDTACPCGCSCSASCWASSTRSFRVQRLSLCVSRVLSRVLCCLLPGVVRVIRGMSFAGDAW